MRAYSSVSQSAPLIRVRSVVQIHIGPLIFRVLINGDIAQLVERLLCKQEAVGSNPSISKNILNFII